MKSVKTKNKFNNDKNFNVEFVKAKKKPESPTKSKISIKSKKVWDDLIEDDFDPVNYKIKGM